MAILDQHGNPIVSQKPEQEEIATARKDIDIYTGWLNRLENPDPVLLTESAGQGLKLYDEIDRDAHAGSVLQTRYLSVVGKEWQVEPAGEAPKRGRKPAVTQEQKIADFVTKCLLDCNFDQARQELLQGILYGFYVGEIMWTVRNGGVTPAKILAKHPKRFTFSLERELRLLTPTNQFDGDPAPQRKFIVFTYGSSDNPYGSGLGRKLWWPVWFKKNNIKFWLVFLEKFGSPTAVGKYPDGTTPEEKAKLLAALDAIQQETGIAIPESMALEFLEAKRGGNVDYQVMCDYMDKQISKAVLGQTATTEGTPGRLGGEEAQEEVRADILKADADLLCECLNATLIPWIVDFNFPQVSDYPKIWIRTGAEKDLKPLAERDKIILVDMGMGNRVPETYISETYGIPLAEQGEAVVGLAPAPGRPGAEFAERRFDPDQEEIESLGDDAVAAAGKAMQAIDEPIRKLIAASSSLEELRDRILDVYSDMDPADLEELIKNALITAALAGAADAGKARRRKI